MKKAVFLVLVCLLLGSCVTSTMVRFRSDVENVDVYIDGEKVGTTGGAPIRLSNAVWKEYDVVLKKPGYQDEYMNLRKEVKVFNFAVGMFLFLPSLLYCYGPEPVQPVIGMGPK